MQISGITGRSGCGKSTLTDSIRAAGFRCVDADQVAREVLLPGSPCIVQLQQEFGADIVDEAGQVRRRLLADRAFATPQGTARLTAITQPEIYHRLDLAMAEARQAGEKLFFVDGAVIVGTPFQKRCSHLVLVAGRMKPACSASVRGMALRRKWRAAAWTLSCPKMSCVPPQTL